MQVQPISGPLGLGQVEIGSDEELIFVPDQSICNDIADPPYNPSLEELLHTDKAKGGAALLASDDIHLKIHWLSHLPDIAVSLVLQIEDSSDLTEKRVKKWLHMEGVWEALFTSKTGRFRALCAAQFPERVLALIRRDKLTKAMRRQLIETRHQYLPEMPPNLAVECVRTLGMQLEDNDKAFLVTCMQKQPIERDLVDWYEKAVPARFDPLNHLRAYRAIIACYPEKQDPAYIAAQEQRMGTADKEVFKSEIEESERKDFACFFRQPKKKNPPQQVVKKVKEIPFWEEAAKELRRSELDAPVSTIKRIYAEKAQIPRDKAFKLWNIIFENRAWLSEPKLLFIFSDFTFFEEFLTKLPPQKKERHVASLVTMLCEAQKFDLAYRYHELFDEGAAKVDLGIALLRCEIQKDSPKIQKILKGSWPKLKRLIEKEIGTKKTTERSIVVAEALMHVLVIGDIEILFEIFNMKFSKYSDAMNNGYIRFLELSAAALDPTHVTRALLIDVDRIPDKKLGRALMLRQIELCGWTDVTAQCFQKFVSKAFNKDFCTSFLSPTYTGRSRAGGESFVCSFCPLEEGNVKKWPYNDEVLSWIDESLTLAEKSKKPEALIDFALQNLRNLVAASPYAEVPLALLERVDMYPEGVYLLQSVAATCVPEQAPVMPIRSSGPIIKALLAPHENVEELVLAQQREVILWQDADGTGDYIELLGALFSLWRKHPEMILNDKLAESLGELMAPNAQLWKKGNMIHFSNYLALLFDNYKVTSADAQLRYLRTLLDMLSNGIRWKLHLGENSALFTKQLESTLLLFHMPYQGNVNRMSLDSLVILLNLSLVALPDRNRLIGLLIKGFIINKRTPLFITTADAIADKLLHFYEGEKRLDQQILDNLNDLAIVVRDMTNNAELKRRCAILLKRAVKIQNDIAQINAQFEKILLE